MKIDLWWSDKLATGRANSFKVFAQMMANRLIVGQARYGVPKAEQQYMSRLKEELKVYQRTGNMEQLINIVNYAWLESEAPENKKFHHDATADSATRSKFGGGE